MKSLMSLGERSREGSSVRTSGPLQRAGKTATSKAQKAPHPIPAGKEGAVCPITGMFADGVVDTRMTHESEKAFAEMQADPDIREELLEPELRQGSDLEEVGDPLPVMTQSIPLNVVRSAHQANSYTRALVRAVGGVPTLRKFTARFYEKAFADPHLDQFIRRHEDAHGMRFANWIAEKFGDGTPWTEERRTRPADIMRIDGEAVRVAYDRSSAHLAAWFSPKRPAHKIGDHFKPEDARVWMRLHFWAAREVGLFERKHAAFMDYYIRFIGHFISVYSSKAPPFTRESARWSASQQNIDRYLAAGNLMEDVIGMNVQDALDDLPVDEQEYTGSKHPNPSWPYA